MEVARQLKLDLVLGKEKINRVTNHLLKYLDNKAEIFTFFTLSGLSLIIAVPLTCRHTRSRVSLGIRVYGEEEGESAGDDQPLPGQTPGLTEAAGWKAEQEVERVLREIVSLGEYGPDLEGEAVRDVCRILPILPAEVSSRKTHSGDFTTEIFIDFHVRRGTELPNYTLTTKMTGLVRALL